MKAALRVTRWCEDCRRFTFSEMDAWGYEICAEHQEPADGEDG